MISKRGSAMIQQGAIESINAAETMADARDRTLRLVLSGVNDHDRRANLRRRVRLIGTRQGLVALAWSLMLDQQGLRLSGAVKAKKGMAWGR